MADPRPDQDTASQDGTSQAGSVTDAEAQVQQAREELAATVTALTERADVKARARDRATRLREEHGPALAGAGIGLVALVVALAVVRKRR
jgi:hypothetical protein